MADLDTRVRQKRKKASDAENRRKELLVHFSDWHHRLRKPGGQLRFAVAGGDEKGSIAGSVARAIHVQPHEKRSLRSRLRH